MKVLKFGGSSVGTPARVQSVVDIVARSAQAGGRVAVVVSAFQGVTDQLIQTGTMASQADETYKEKLAAIETRHLEATNELVPVGARSGVLANVKVWLNMLADVLHGVYLVREISPRTLDLVMSFGERLSAYLLSECMKARGIDAAFVDARDVVRTNRSFGSARVDFERTYDAFRALVRDRKELLVVTGFIGATEQGETTTLGRGGSDYTAALFGAAVGATEIEIWTDVDGVMTADPRKVQKAFPLAALSYEEAMELCHFGAKVIYPPTVQPAFDGKIPLRIRNTFNPEFSGTIITEKSAGHGFLVTGISSIEKIALLRVQGSGMVGVAGIAMRLFGALARRGISIILITQASSEHTICLAVPPGSAGDAKSAIHEEFGLEIQAGLLDEVVVEQELAIVSAVGENMRNTPGIAGRLFHALGRNGINIVAIAQGSSELNISVVVKTADEAKALNALHDQFFLSDTKSLNVFLVGTGLIGGTLLDQIEKHSRHLKRDLSLDLRIVGISNSRKSLLDPKGVPLDKCRELLEQTAEKLDVASFVTRMKAMNLPNSVFVDCTASDHVVKHYLEVLESSISIVTPNKRAQTGPAESYLALKRTARARNVELLYETSVGAGLPVISTLNDLLRSGDEIVRIEAVLSGTLSFIFNTFQAGMTFTEVVKEAKRRGYTEPDPRDDLGGLDVARKLLILARESGATLEFSGIEVENLVPPRCRECQSVDEFFHLLEEENGAFEERRANAAKHDRKLCYIASIEGGKAKVSLKEVDRQHPFHGLSGSDNIISFTTKRYCDRPLVVKGPGAGAEVTAAGVFADIIRIANYAR